MSFSVWRKCYLILSLLTFNFLPTLNFHCRRKPWREYRCGKTHTIHPFDTVFTIVNFHTFSFWFFRFFQVLSFSFNVHLSFSKDFFHHFEYLGREFPRNCISHTLSPEVWKMGNSRKHEKMLEKLEKDFQKLKMRGKRKLFVCLLFLSNKEMIMLEYH